MSTKAIDQHDGSPVDMSLHRPPDCPPRFGRLSIHSPLSMNLKFPYPAQLRMLTGNTGCTTSERASSMARGRPGRITAPFPSAHSRGHSHSQILHKSHLVKLGSPTARLGDDRERSWKGDRENEVGRASVTSSSSLLSHHALIGVPSRRAFFYDEKYKGNTPAALHNVAIHL